MKQVLKWLSIVFGMIVLIMIYARYVGTMGLVTKEYTINDKDITDEFDGLKIVHFSDLHYNRAINLSKVKKIVKEINLINPDIVVFTGDLIDQDANLSSDDYDELGNVLKSINSRYGKYAVMGNHDYSKDKDGVIKIFNTSGFKYLDNEYDLIYNKKGEKIFIGGINTINYNQDDIENALGYLKDKNDNDYRIILVHEPDITDKIIPEYKVNLILAGHSHNGQVRLPIIGALYTPEGAKKYYDNYYEVNGTDLYISSGIGVSTFNYRLFNHPSINFYRINKETSN